MRRSFAFGIWLIVTVAATALVWTAVSVVAADVTDRPAPVVAHHDVVVALGSVPSTIAAATTTTRLKPPPSTVAPAAVGRTTPVPVTTVPRTTLPPLVPTPRTTTPLTIPSTTQPVVPPSPTTRPPVPSAAYSTPGGVVTVACTSPFTIRLLAATPNDGFLVIVINSGPGQVQVELVSQDQAYEVDAVCFFGQPIRTPPHP